MTLARFLLISQFVATIAVENDIVKLNSHFIQDNPSSYQRIFQTRSLEVGDFDSINQIFNGTTILLPDTDFNQGSLQLGLRTLQCKELMIGDITSEWNTYNSSSIYASVGYEETLAYEITVSPFSLTCSADYSWALGNIGFLRGSGNLKAISTNSNAKVRIDFNSETGFQNDFPSNVDFQSCEAALNIDDINFEGGLIGEVLSLAENLISNFVEDQVKKLICDKLLEAGPPVFNKFFNKTSSQINEWMQPVSDELADPLYIERNILAKNQTLINFMSETNESNIFEGIMSLIQEQNTVSSLVLFAINQVDNFLGRNVTDSGKSDMYFNVLLRKTNILDDNRVLDFKFDGNDEIPAFQADPVLFDPKNPIQVEIKLNGVRASGLDTATNISALNAIGAQTLQTSLSWDVLDFEFD